MNDTVLFIGATSAIARAIAEQCASRGFHLVLAGRDVAELAIIAADLHIRFQVPTHTMPFDAEHIHSHEAFISECLKVHGPLRGAVVAVGYLGDQERSQKEMSEAEKIIHINFTAVVSVVNALANAFEALSPSYRKRPKFICILSSVAGDRGRQSNYMYGAAKGALSVYAQGLRNRLHRIGVTVSTIKPGFVDTKMSYGRQGMFLVADPSHVGADIYRAIVRQKDIVYVPGFWRWIMWIIQRLPERLFKRLRL